MRGNTKKYLPVFREYVTRFGWDTVEETLKKGRSGNVRLKLTINRKDRNEILLELRKEVKGVA